MTEAKKNQVVRESVLASLNAVQPNALPASTLIRGAREYGVPVTETELNNHLNRLANEGLVEALRSHLSAGVVRYKITDEGVKILTELGMA